MQFNQNVQFFNQGKNQENQGRNQDHQRRNQSRCAQQRLSVGQDQMLSHVLLFIFCLLAFFLIRSLSSFSSGDVGFQNPRTAQIPAKQGKHQHYHNWPCHRDGLKLDTHATKKGAKTTEGQMVHFHAATGSARPFSAGGMGQSIPGSCRLAYSTKQHST